jgi:uncharacterized membrane protein YedE/YeeE
VKGRFGIAQDWFKFGFSFFGVGIAAFAGSFNKLDSLLAWEPVFRFAGVSMFVVGVAIIFFGILVWKYNDNRSDTPLMIVADQSLPSTTRVSRLIDERDALEVEKAGLEAVIAPGIFDLGLMSASRYTTQTQEGLERAKTKAEAQTRLRQIATRISAINLEIRSISQSQV